MSLDGGSFTFGIVLCSAVLLDAILGDPQNFPHPVIAIGRVIDFWHQRLFTSCAQLLSSLQALLSGLRYG